MLQYPAILPPPILKFNLEYGEVFKKTTFSYGVRFRATQNIILPPNTLTFTLKLGCGEYELFRQFLYDINNGLDWFTANWEYDGINTGVKEFHFDTYPKFSKSGAYWNADFTCTVKE
jgi:hypothetical protein